MNSSRLFLVLKAISTMLLLLLTLMGAKPARGDDCNQNFSAPKTIVLGSLMGIVDYWLGVTMHEGSHALVAKAYGADITEFSILPSHTASGNLIFGHVKFENPKQCEYSLDDHGVRTFFWAPCPYSDGKEALILIAPKITDLAIMGGYAALFETGNLPKNRYLKLATTVLAVGAWVDFSKDILRNHSQNDMVRFYKDIGAETQSERFGYKLAYMGLILGSGVEMGRGVYSLFKDDKKPASKPSKYDGHLTLSPNSIGWAGTF